jgi:hypothetical protein
MIPGMGRGQGLLMVSQGQRLKANRRRHESPPRTPRVCRRQWPGRTIQARPAPSVFTRSASASRPSACPVRSGRGGILSGHCRRLVRLSKWARPGPRSSPAPMARANDPGEASPFGLHLVAISPQPFDTPGQVGPWWHPPGHCRRMVRLARWAAPAPRSAPAPKPRANDPGEARRFGLHLVAIGSQPFDTPGQVGPWWHPLGTLPAPGGHGQVARPGPRSSPAPVARADNPGEARPFGILARPGRGGILGTLPAPGALV